MAKVAAALGDWSAEAGRGRRHVLAHPDGGAITLIDESYNANPASMKAALDLLKSTPVGEGGRRIAVLGDMLELGRQSQALHAALADPVVDAGANPVFLAGAHMASLAGALPDSISVTTQDTAEALKPIVFEALKGGDVVMLKASKSIGFSKLIDAMLKTYPARAGAATQSAGSGD